MAFDWLYGPATRNSEDLLLPQGMVYTRSLVLDLDDVVETAEILERYLPGAPARFVVDSVAGERDVDRTGLKQLADVELARLRLIKSAESENGTDYASVSFTLGFRPGIYMPPAHQHVARMVATHLLERGHPRVYWTQHRRLLPFAGVLVVASAWIWAAATSELPVALQVFGWLLVGCVSVGAFFIRRSIHVSAYSGPGHFVRKLSRQEVDLHRANTRRDVRVVLLTSPLTVGAGFALAVLTNAFGLQ